MALRDQAYANLLFEKSTIVECQDPYDASRLQGELKRD